MYKEQIVCVLLRDAHQSCIYTLANIEGFFLLDALGVRSIPEQ